MTSTRVVDPLLGECYDVLEGKPRVIVLYGGRGYVMLTNCSPRLCPVGRTADYAIVQAARTSYGKGLKSKKEDDILLDYLSRKQHKSPEEFTRVMFELVVPIFVARQLFRHRMANYCEYSLRYAEAPDTFFKPDVFRKQDTVNKQSSCGSVDDGAGCEEIWDECINRAHATYERLLEKGVCREQARAVLPLATFTKIHMSIDLRNLFNLLSLRMDSHAQEEIRVMANAMHDLIQPIVPDALACWHLYTLESLTLTKHELDAIRMKSKTLQGTSSKSAQADYEKKLNLLNLDFLSQ